MSVICLCLGLLVLWAPRLNIDDNIAADPRLEPYQTPKNAQYCADWALGVRSHGHVSVSFELPRNADLLFFLSRGPVYGHIHVINGGTASGPVIVNVSAQSHDGGNLRRTKAEPRNPHGDPRRDVQFNITIILKTGGFYKDLTTELALFNHSFDPFFSWGSLFGFEAIRLWTSNASMRPLTMGYSLMGGAMFIQTSNAEVRGGFVGFTLGTQVQLTTSNGAINADMSLISRFKSNTLRAVVQTSAGPVTINRGFTGKNAMAPASDSYFFLDVVTSFGAVTAELFPSYEGTYDLQTSLARPEVEQDPDIRDPLGKGRNRMVIKTRVGEHALKGSMYWSQDGETPDGFSRGAVKITTSQSPITLFC
ncbi:hypothetical protein DFH07DRAFT_971854 [Mycena maculata]|uniref:Uncharacterized protein n=1 Tax=Mycena maculata TaxID=230809 RepID=A0AAD7HKA3_9AGAR|nr:hypothetical protein DFH07DRAFT_971854 [Mycena maculata]